ncbi:hypothetical protein [Microcoleus sp. herbarium14]|uniref:hypothetical protein n=1 Tax=Microcoleus sp. herbarium14 TaxID=3055439 RepID=UPI002FD20DE9
MNSITLLHNFLTNTTNIFNFVVSVELAVACICGVWQGFWHGEASVSKIALLATITAIMFRLWQSWPHEFVLLTVWPQCAFWVFVGGLVGCTFKWVFEQAVVRN